MNVFSLAEYGPLFLLLPLGTAPSGSFHRGNIVKKETSYPEIYGRWLDVFSCLDGEKWLDMISPFSGVLVV